MTMLEPEVTLVCDGCGHEEFLPMDLRYSSYSGKNPFWIEPKIPAGWISDGAGNHFCCEECSQPIQQENNR